MSRPAWAAARDAARAALAPTVTALQTSALGLLDRMLDVAPGPFNDFAGVSLDGEA